MPGTSIVDIKVQYIQSPLVTKCTIRCVRLWYLRSNVGSAGMQAAARADHNGFVVTTTTNIKIPILVRLDEVHTVHNRPESIQPPSLSYRC
jgi:hypothetical protein